MELRKKNDLCFKCGAKWGHNHKCPNQVPLHVLEEVLDALEPTDFQDDELETKVEEKVVLVVASSKGFKGVKRRTMRISGVIGKLNVLILINSGSVGTFISEQLARKLQLDTVSCSQIQLVAADGSPMLCNQRILNLQWCSQDHTFHSSTGILPITCFDMILGEGLVRGSQLYVGPLG
jgi:hypothetical protein